jgi:hypothetical protein|tara:strand:+ start:793 stop:1029 length:237 start_codon:yes stop_codon:yes gene_type:complete
MKKPPNAYILYRKYNYKEVMKNYPDASFSERSTILTTQWKKLSEDNKTKYYNESYILKEKYEMYLKEHNNKKLSKESI